MNILILDDDRSIVDIFRKNFEYQGHVCLTATNNTEAFSKAKLLKFDVLILDLDLGTDRGEDFARIYKRDNPWIKIIVVTALPDPSIRDLQYDKLLTKPVSMSELNSYIKNGGSSGRPKEIPRPESIKLDDRDSMLIIELINKVVEHTNIVATTQALLTENLEEVITAMDRLEEKSNYSYEMLRQVDRSEILKAYEAIRKLLRKALSKIFWAIVILVSVYLLKGPLLTFMVKVLGG